ncbi:MAG: LacI family DNA-binding transcriptional regulator, partial [Sciscionella sp.]
VLAHSRRGAREATQHLLDAGWNRPACITGPKHAATAQQRRAGYLDALTGQQRRQATSLIRHADYRANSARTALADLLNKTNPPDSLFVANAPMALGVLEELDHRGLRPGTDIGLIAFDDAPWAPFVTPPLSVVAQPAYDIGHHAGQLLLDRINNPRTTPEPRTVTLHTELVIRTSSTRSPR